MTRELMATFGWFVDSFRPATSRAASQPRYRWQPDVTIRDGRTACTLMDFSYS
jgi:hypothetical protein